MVVEFMITVMKVIAPAGNIGLIRMMGMSYWTASSHPKHGEKIMTLVSVQYMVVIV
jgi:hypothetical protein